MSKSEESLLAKIKATELQAQQLKAQYEKIEAKKRAEAEKKLTRMKILLGAFLVEVSKKDPSFEIPNSLTHEVPGGGVMTLDAFLTRKGDRELFGLTTLASQTEETAKS